MKKLTTLLVAMLFSAGMAFAQSNEAVVSQSGDDNTADIEQVGDLNYTSLSQADGATADIDQVSATESFVSLSQVGASNATILQNNKNSVQGFNDQWNTPESNKLATQSGSGSTMEITQLSTWNQAYVDQFGDNNTMSVFQDDGNSNVARLIQDGNDNVMDIDLIGGTNRIKGEQYSDGNMATVIVTGSHNNEFNNGTSFVYQDGMQNTATVTVTGDFNFYDISQIGSNNMANLSLAGNNNVATVTQSN